MISLEKKNEYLHYLLSALQQSSSAEQDEARNPPGSSSQLERTYKKALADYKLASDQLEAQTAVTSKDATELRARLDEKDKKAEKQLQTLVKYRADVARQSSFANGRPLSEEQFEGLQSQEMSEDLERERLRYITNKANVTQLEQKLKKKNELSGGVSDAEYHKLSSDLNRIDKKIKSYDAEIENMLMDREKLRKMESFLTTAISNYSERNMSKESELRELNEGKHMLLWSTADSLFDQIT